MSASRTASAMRRKVDAARTVMTVTAVMSYDQVSGMKSCVQQLCLDSCNYQEMQAIWDRSVCAGTDAGLGDGGTGPTGSSGCHCAAAAGAPSVAGGLAGALLAAAVVAGRRRRRRDPSRRGRP